MNNIILYGGYIEIINFYSREKLVSSYQWKQLENNFEKARTEVIEKLKIMRLWHQLVKEIRIKNEN